MMDSMYGRLEPKPAAPSYTPEELAAMARAEEARALEGRLLEARDASWKALIESVPPGMGLARGSHVWQQNQSHVTLQLRLQEGAAPKQARCICASRLPSAASCTCRNRRHQNTNLRLLLM